MSPADRFSTRAVLAWSAAGLIGLVLTLLSIRPTPAEDDPKNPYLGQPEAIEEGERIYRSRCYGCHFRAGGRGPNIFQTSLSAAQFLDAVANGRKNGMPAWSSVLPTDEIWKVHAFVISRDRL